MKAQLIFPKTLPLITRRFSALKLKGKKLLLVLVIVLATGSGCLRAARIEEKEAEEIFRQANALFRQGNEVSSTNPSAARDLYVRAAMHYERLVGEGGLQSSKLYYNLGNTYFRAGDLGRAILSYRRAAALESGNQDLERNLDFARSRRMDKIVEPERRQVLKTLFFWHYDLPLGWKRGLFAFFSLIFWTCASLFLFFRRSALKWAMVFTLAPTCLLLISLAIDQYNLTNDRSGVILSGEVIARKGDGESYEPSFQEPLHTGTEFTLVEKRPGWFHIRLSDERECWVPEKSAGLVRPESPRRTI